MFNTQLTITILLTVSISLTANSNESSCNDIELREIKKLIIAKKVTEECRLELQAQISRHKSIGNGVYQLKKIEIPVKKNFSLSSFLPTYIKNNLGRYEKKRGANCFNTALAANGFSPLKSRGDHPTSFFMGLFKGEMKLVKVPVFGDMILFFKQYREKEGPLIHNYSSFLSEIYHAGFYLSNNYIFTKNGEDKTAPYKLDTLAGSINKYATGYAAGFYSDEIGFLPDNRLRRYYMKKGQAEYLRFLEGNNEENWNFTFGGYFILRKTGKTFNYSKMVNRERLNILTDLKKLLKTEKSRLQWRELSRIHSKRIQDLFFRNGFKKFLEMVEHLDVHNAILVYDIMNTVQKIRSHYPRFGPYGFREWNLQTEVTRRVILVTKLNIKMGEDLINYPMGEALSARQNVDEKSFKEKGKSFSNIANPFF